MTRPESSQQPLTKPPVKVLYIAGWGRSGTTVLDAILGAHKGIFSGGELHYLWERGFLEHRKCGCSLPLEYCPLWQEIFGVAFGQTAPDPRHVVELQNDLVRLRHTPSLLMRPMSAKLREYTGIQSKLYQAIAQVTGDSIIVDSSKRPSDAATLARTPGVEPYLLHVVRDPRAVAFSWRRQKAQLDRPVAANLLRHNAADSTLSWVTWNAGTKAIARRFPDGHYLQMRYEDFAQSPKASVQKILDLIGAAGDGGDSPFLDDRTVVLPGNHTASGNPNRFRTGEITIRTDDVWRKEQRWIDRQLATVIAAPMLGRYGYRGSVRATAPDAVSDAAS